MVNILVIDDGFDKINTISTILLELPFKSHVEHNIDISSARRAMRSKHFDIVIVDLNIKPSPTSPAEIEVGLDFIDLSFNDKKCILPKEFFFLTELEDKSSELKLKVANRYSKLWYYQQDFAEWKAYLQSRVKFYHEYNNRNKYDVVIIAALEEEFTALTQTNEIITWNKHSRKNQVSYCIGRIYIKEADIELTCLAVSPYKKGMSSTAALTSMIIGKYNPRVSILVGLCAGTDPEKQQFGDTIISSFIWDYHSGKITSDGFVNAPFQTKATDDLMDIFLSEFSGDQNRHNDFAKVNFKDISLAKNWTIHCGPTVSGGSVIADEEMIKLINQQHKDILGIDMEGYGFYEALQLCPDVSGCMIKSISDFGNNKKNDAHRKLALTMTNRVLKDLIQNSEFLELFNDY